MWNTEPVLVDDPDIVWFWLITCFISNVANENGGTIELGIRSKVFNLRFILVLTEAEFETTILVIIAFVLLAVVYNTVRAADADPL